MGGELVGCGMDTLELPARMAQQTALAAVLKGGSGTARHVAVACAGADDVRMLSDKLQGAEGLSLSLSLPEDASQPAVANAVACAQARRRPPPSCTRTPPRIHQYMLR